MWISKEKYLRLVRELEGLQGRFNSLNSKFEGLVNTPYSYHYDRNKSFVGVRENLELLMDYLGVERKEETINKIVKKNETN